MARFFTRLAVAGVLALLAVLPGCTAFPPGGDLHLRFTGSPLGVEFGYTQAATIIASGPDGYSVQPGATLTTQPTTAPATAPTSRP